MQYPDLNFLCNYFTSISNLCYVDQGGQKTVYKGLHNQFGYIVLKIFFINSNQRIEREISVSRECQIPNVPKLFECDNVIFNNDSFIYIIEEFIEGDTLHNILKKKGPLSLDQSIQILNDLLETATFLEKFQLVHRDIKPSNIIITPHNQTWLIDFGIARHLDKSSITPTINHFGPHSLGYAAPEQIRNMKKDIDIRADLFSIGIVFYQSYTGNNPFYQNASTGLDVIRRTENFIVPSLVIPEDKTGEFAQFISLLIQKFPSRRPASAQKAYNWFTEIKKILSK